MAWNEEVAALPIVATRAPKGCRRILRGLRWQPLTARMRLHRGGGTTTNTWRCGRGRLPAGSWTKIATTIARHRLRAAEAHPKCFWKCSSKSKSGWKTYLARFAFALSGEKCTLFLGYTNGAFFESLLSLRSLVVACHSFVFVALPLSFFVV